MFNNKYQPYEPVKTHDDSGDEIELQNQSNRSESTNSTITNLLKLTAHRRIRKSSNSQSQSRSIDLNHHDTVISIDDDNHEDDNESSQLITKKSISNDLNVMDDIDLDNAHASSEGEGDQNDNTDNYDDYVLLLYLDGKKKKVGIMNTWKVWQIKEKYFKSELTERKNVRLIYRGKMLQDRTNLNSYNIPSGGFIHVSISKNGNLYRGGATNSASGSQLDGTDGDGDVNYDNFDDGMDDAAVARRLQMQYNNEVPGRPQWMNGGPDNNPGFNDQEYVQDPNRARREFLCGMFLGSVAGIWILIFLILANRNQYSRRFRLGVTLGVAINLIVQLTYQYDNVNEGDPANGESGDDGTGSNVTETETGENIGDDGGVTN